MQTTDLQEMDRVELALLLVWLQNKSGSGTWCLCTAEVCLHAVINTGPPIRRRASSVTEALGKRDIFTKYFYALALYPTLDS